MIRTRKKKRVSPGGGKKANTLTPPYQERAPFHQLRVRAVLELHGLKKILINY
jgi:hypothetical protein